MGKRIEAGRKRESKKSTNPARKCERERVREREQAHIHTYTREIEKQTKANFCHKKQKNRNYFYSELLKHLRY